MAGAGSKQTSYPVKKKDQVGIQLTDWKCTAYNRLQFERHLGAILRSILPVQVQQITDWSWKSSRPPSRKGVADVWC